MLSFLSRDYVGEETPKELARRRGTDVIRSGLFAHATGALMVAVVGRPEILAFWLGLVLIVAGTPMLVVGCSRRALSKGYSRFMGTWGLLSFAGVLVLILLPDRNRQRPGFEVVMPMKVSTTWAPPDEDPKWMPRSWGQEDLRDER